MGLEARRLAYMGGQLEKCMDKLSETETERDIALAQVASLKKERDKQRLCCAILWQEVKGKCEECSVFFGGGCQDDGTCNLRKVLDLTYEAAERVNALVEALEAYSSEDTWGDDGEIARQALAEWRKNQ